ncbi:MAG: nitronate monooxygenase [Halobacteriovoraceae bacterium]|nr:nitronate monooxygenase [Halobacteriovoraceae bacterium]MCB9093559.1 nitronate monooxygenase [Halobacteriovoraceae bacterium]
MIPNQDIKNFCERFELELPIIQAGMVWVSGAKLASACANNGIMGTLGGGSMPPGVLEKQIEKCRDLTDANSWKRVAINFPLLYKDIEKQIEIALKYNIKTFITSAGSPKKFTGYLKSKNKNVIHVTSSPLLALKCEAAGVDAIVAEGFEAGGHNGREELTTMVLIPQVVDSVKIPVIAAGGISDVRQVHAAHALGAHGVQIGSRFAATVESSAHFKFKEAIVKAKFGDTKLMMKKHVPVRLLDNTFAREIDSLEQSGAPNEELIKVLGKGRAKKGMHEGDLEQGELEIGQVSGMINDIPSAKNLIEGYRQFYSSSKIGL